MRNLVRALEIITDMLAGRPQVDGVAIAHEKSIGKRVHSISMNRTEVPLAGILRRLLPVVLAVLAFTPLTPAQSDQPEGQAAQAGPNQQPTQQTTQQTTQQPTKPIPPPEEPKGDVKITPRQAEELFHTVDEILRFDSKETGLAIKRDVKRKLTSRDEVVSFLTKHLNDED